MRTVPLTAIGEVEAGAIAERDAYPLVAETLVAILVCPRPTGAESRIRGGAAAARGRARFATLPGSRSTRSRPAMEPSSLPIILAAERGFAFADLYAIGLVFCAIRAVRGDRRPLPSARPRVLGGHHLPRPRRRSRRSRSSSSG